MSIEITPSVAKDLVISYGDHTFTLSGRIPPEILEARASVPIPRFPSKGGKDEYTENVGVSVIAAFSTTVLPAAFREVLDLSDVPKVFKAWSEHVKLGEQKNSDD